ncbi:MAG: MATE family efflux transporter [Clostridia bacterium]|nr:MATE family efflux transporter [Clostridia bacterium]
MTKSMISGKPLGLIIRFSFPLMIGTLVQQMYSWVDAIMVGKLVGNSALAAVGATGSINFLILGFLGGIAEGSCILAARFFGADDRRGLKRCIANIIYVCFAVVAVLTLLALIFNKRILLLMKTPETIINDAAAYIGVIYAGMFGILIYNLCAGIMRALGDSRSPLYFLIASSLLNIALNYVFMVPFEMGVMGAALATVISQLISGVLSLIYMIRKYDILRLSKDDFRIRIPMIIKICGMGIPMAFQYSITAIGALALQFAINTLGEDAITAYTVGEKVLGLFNSFINCIGVALSNFCSQNMGAGRLTRIKHGVASTTVTCILLSVICTTILITAGDSIALLFLEQRTDSITQLLQTYFRMQSPAFIALCMIFIFRNTVMGLGYSLQGMLAGVFELVGRTVVALVFVGTYGFAACCLASPAAWVMADILLIPLYFYIIRSLAKRHPSWITESE